MLAAQTLVVRDDAMTPNSEHYAPVALSDLLNDANAVTPKLIAELIDLACRRFPLHSQISKRVRIEQLIDARAWTDAALALIDLELPLWHIRRIVYDAGEWYCALSRQRELPEWLDQSIEGRHPDLALAILTAFVEAQGVNLPSARPSVPAVPREHDPDRIPLCWRISPSRALRRRSAADVDYEAERQQQPDAQW